MRFERIEVGKDDCIVLPVAEGYRDCVELIRSDLFRRSGRRMSVLRVIAHVLTHPLSIQVWQRL